MAAALEPADPAGMPVEVVMLRSLLPHAALAGSSLQRCCLKKAAAVVQPGTYRPCLLLLGRPWGGTGIEQGALHGRCCAAWPGIATRVVHCGRADTWGAAVPKCWRARCGALCADTFCASAAGGCQGDFIIVNSGMRCSIWPAKLLLYTANRLQMSCFDAQYGLGSSMHAKWRASKSARHKGQRLA